MDSQVFGRIAGENALEEPGPDEETCAGLAEASLATLQQRLTGGALTPAEIRGQLQDVASESASVMRVGDRLERGLAELAKLRAAGIKAAEKEAVGALEALNLLDTAEMVLSAALKRDESRGPHLRFRSFDDPTPLPRHSPEWDRYIVIQRAGGKLTLEPRQPTPLPF